MSINEYTYKKLRLFLETKNASSNSGKAGCLPEEAKALYRETYRNQGCEYPSSLLVQDARFVNGELLCNTSSVNVKSSGMLSLNSVASVVSNPVRVGDMELEVERNVVGSPSGVSHGGRSGLAICESHKQQEKSWDQDSQLERRKDEEEDGRIGAQEGIGERMSTRRSQRKRTALKSNVK